MSAHVPLFVKRTFRLALTIVALVLIGVYVDLGAVLETLRSGSISLLLIAGVLVVPNVLLDAWTWRELLLPMLIENRAPSAEETVSSQTDGGRQRLSLRLVLASVLAGYTGAFFTPARVGEFGARALTLRPGDHDTFDGWDISITVAAQRFIDTLVAVCGGWIAVLIVRENVPLSPGWDHAATVGLGVGGAVILTLGISIARPDWIGSLLRRFAPSATSLHERAALFRRVGARQAVRVVAGCAIRYVIFATQLAVLVRAFAPGVSAMDLALATGVTYYVKVLTPSLTFLDVGVREGAAILAFGWMGVPEAAALNAALIIFFVNLALPAAAGAFFLKQQSIPTTPSHSAT